MKNKLLYNIIWWVRYGIWNWVSDRPRKSKSFFQRGYRGWADEDIWSFDYYLSTIIIEGLAYLKRHQNTLPTYQPLGKETMEAAQKRWDSILDKIINAFKYAKMYINGDECITPTIWEEKYEKDYEEGMNLFKEHFFSLWD